MSTPNDLARVARQRRERQAAAERYREFLRRQGYTDREIEQKIAEQQQAVEGES